MSAAATAYVIKFSPYKGVGYALHLMVADVVNDANDNRFWMSPSELARKARTTRVSASNWLWQEAVRDGLLEVVVDNRSVRSPGTGYAPASEFRFLEPALPAAYEPQWKTKQGPPPSPPAKPTRVNADDAARVQPVDAAQEPRKDAVRGPVNSDNAAIREPAGQGVEPRKESLRVTQDLTKTSQLNNPADAETGAAVQQGVEPGEVVVEESTGPDGTPHLFAVPAAEATASAITQAALRDAGPGIQWPTPKWRKGDDEDPKRVHDRQVQQVRQALRGWALGRLLANDDPDAVTAWAVELCRRVPATRWSADRLHEEWERMTGRAPARGAGAGMTADSAGRLNVRQIIGNLQKRATDFSLSPADREVLLAELRRRVEVTFSRGQSAPGALTSEDARILSRAGFSDHPTSDAVHAICTDIRSRMSGADPRPPEASAAEEAFRAIASASQPSTTRALTEGSTA